MLMALFSLTSCSLFPIRLGDDRITEARNVRTVPAGFIELNTAVNDLQGVLDLIGWSNNIVFQDAEGVTFFQTNSGNDEFVVRYRGNLYVNGEMFSEIVDTAITVYQQTNKIYDIGDVMEFRGLTRSGAGPRLIHTLTITSIERFIIDRHTVYEIKFTTSDHTLVRYHLEFFEFIETRSGGVYSDFVLIDEETVHIKIDSYESIDMIILSIPQGLRVSVTQNSIRRIKVDNSKRDY